MANFTHYSLFETGKSTIVDFAPLPAGGLVELLSELHQRLVGEKTNYCVGISDGTLHPGASQIGFQLNFGKSKLTLILMTRGAVADHAGELASEGNASAALAAAAASIEV